MWKFRIGNEEYGAPSIELMAHYVKDGRLTPDSYVLHPVLNRWMFAKEVPELAVLFPKKQSAARGSCGLAVALFLFAMALGILGLGQNFAILLGLASFGFAFLGGVLYVLKR